jgi:hypothetical protein
VLAVHGYHSFAEAMLTKLAAEVAGAGAPALAQMQ